jgi:hypothetical protein
MTSTASEGRQETGGPNRTPRSEIVQAVPSTRESEPVLLLDLSTSMNWSAEDENDTNGEFPAPQSRRAIAINALPLLVKALEDQDSQAEHEQADGSDEMGGLLTFGFSGTAVEIGDLNSSNLERRLNEITWGGGTEIMPAWELARAAFDEEFGDRPEADRPTHKVLVLTDGEATDFHKFEAVIASASSKLAIIVMILGHGAKALATYRAYKEAGDRQQKQDKFGKSHVSVVLFDGVTDPAEIGEDMVTLAT